MENVGQVRSDIECNQNAYLICYRIAQTRASRSREENERFITGSLLFCILLSRKDNQLGL